MDCDDAFSAAPDNVMDNAMDGDMMIIDHNEEVLERLGDESIPNEPTGSIRINAITKGLDQSYPPIDNVEDMFLDAVTTACERFGLDKIVDHFNRRPLKVATMCSGTDSPILAFRLIKEGKNTR